MAIRVEFFGIPRHRAGVASVVVPIAGPISLEAVLGRLAAEFPDFAAECLAGDHLRSSYVANIDGQQFVRDPNTQLADNSCLLIMSADAGG